MATEKPKVDQKIVEKCKEHRTKLHLPNPETFNIAYNGWCHDYLMCYDDCPVKEERDKIHPPPNYKHKCTKCGKGFDYKSRGEGLCDSCDFDTRYTQDEHALTVARQVGLPEDKPKPKKSPSRELENFLNLQSRVIDKLSRHPEIYRLLDNLFPDQIIERLRGKTGLEAVPVHLGGQTKLKASKSTEQHFAELEKKFAEEGIEPYESTAPVEAEPLEDTWQSDGWKVLFDAGKKREKKTGKKPKEKQEND